MNTAVTVANQSTTSVSIKNEDGSMMQVSLPNHLAALSQTLPLACMLLSGQKQLLVDSRDLHAALEIGRDHATWLRSMVKKHELVEGVDYHVHRPDTSDVTTLAEIRANGGYAKNYYALTVDAGNDIAVYSGAEKGKQLLRYMREASKLVFSQHMDDLGNLLAAERQKHLAETKELKQLNRDLFRDRSEVLNKLDALAKEKGAQSGSLYEIEARHKDLRAKLSDDLALERQKCNMLENGMKYMHSSKWKQERCEDLFAIAQSALERAEREGECYSDPY